MDPITETERNELKTALVGHLDPADFDARYHAFVKGQLESVATPSRDRWVPEAHSDVMLTVSLLVISWKKLAELEGRIQSGRTLAPWRAAYAEAMNDVEKAELELRALLATKYAPVRIAP